MKQPKNFLAIGLISVVQVAALSAEPAPRITDVLGILNNGEAITITGQDFGIKDQAAPIIFDMVDEAWINGVLNNSYASLADGSIVPQGAQYPWAREGAFGKGPIRIGPSPTGPYGSRSRTYYGKFEDAQQDGWIEWPAGFPDPFEKLVDEVFIRWYLWMDFEIPNGPNKFIRVWNSRGSASDGIRISWSHDTLGYQRGSLGAINSWHSLNGEIVGAWNLMELYVNVQSGVIKAWVNGILNHDITDFAPDNPADYDGIQPRLWGYDGARGDQTGQLIKFTDYWADSTRARVEICDAPKWLDCAIREPQPAITWTNDEISVRINSGALPDLSSSFVYVITDSGITNWIGYPLSGVQRPAPPAQLSGD